MPICALWKRMYGINRMVLNTETVVFTPWQVAQFKIAGFFSLISVCLEIQGIFLKNDFLQP